MPPVVEINIGPDVVHLVGDNVTIFASRAMADWTIREFSRRPIFFQGRKFFLLRKTPGPVPYAFRYELEPWSDGLGLESTQSITYDESYVRERERNHRVERKHDLLHPALMCVYPFLGLMWSGFKERVLASIGFDLVEITGASIFLSFCFFMLEGVFVLYFRGGLIAPFCGRYLFDSMLWVDRGLLIIVPLDAALRYSQILRHEDSLDGFLEWAFRPFFKKS